MILKKLIFALLIMSIAGCSVPSKVVQVYFLKEGKLFPVSRELPTIENPVLIAMDQLLKGPSEQEEARGIITEIPPGTRARKVDVEGDVAIIDFNSTLAGYQGNNAKGLIAQIVSTATSVKGIKQVIIKLQGSDQFTIGSEEYLIDHPLEKDDVKI